MSSQVVTCGLPGSPHPCGSCSPLTRTRPQNLRGVTLVELMVSLVVLSILASLSLAGLAGARASAKRAKTVSTIRKLSEVILPYYEEYDTRRPRIPVAAETTILNLPGGRSLLQEVKRIALCRLMTLELPERVHDLNIDASGSYTTDFTAFVGSLSVSITEVPPAARRLRGLIAGNNTPADLARIGNCDSGELLYLIVTRGAVADPDIVAHFRADEVGDPDNDGLLEFVDGQGKGINFKRWPIGFRSPMQPLDGARAGISELISTNGHRLIPLIYSSGSDERFDINEHRFLTYGATRPGVPQPNPSISFNPFAYNAASNTSLLADPAYPTPFPAFSVVSVPVRCGGSTPVTFQACGVDKANRFSSRMTIDGCNPLDNAAFITVGSPTGPDAADNIHNHDMTR